MPNGQHDYDSGRRSTHSLYKYLSVGQSILGDQIVWIVQVSYHLGHDHEASCHADCSSSRFPIGRQSA